MSDILEEILNDEKEAKRLKLFRKLFPAIITLTIIVALGIAGYSWFLQAKTTHNRALSLYIKFWHKILLFRNNPYC